MNATVLEFPPIVESKTEVATVVMSIKDAAVAHLRAKEPEMRALAEKYRAVAFDMTTPKGMTTAKAARTDLRENGRFAIQRGRDATKDLLNTAKKDVEAEADRLIDIVRPIEDNVHAQIEARQAALDAEAAERKRLDDERIAGHRTRLAAIRECVAKSRGISSARIANGMTAVGAIVIEAATWEEFTQDAHVAKTETLAAMQALFDAAKADEEAVAAREAQRIEQTRVAEEQRVEAARLQEARDMIARAEREAAANIEADRKALAVEKAAWLAEQEASRPKPQNETHPVELTEVRPRDEGMAPEACESATGRGEDVAPALAVAPNAKAPAESAQVGGKDVLGDHAEQRSPSPADSRTPINLSAIKERLGFALSRDFIEGELGIASSHMAKASVYWPESAWPGVKAKLIEHIVNLA